VVRGPVDAPEFNDYILPSVFLKRLSDVFDDEIEHLAHEFGDRQMAATLVEQDHVKGYYRAGKNCYFDMC
jgi:type I restriction enzyme M protein